MGKEIKCYFQVYNVPMLRQKYCLFRTSLSVQTKVSHFSAYILATSKVIPNMNNGLHFVMRPFLIRPRKQNLVLPSVTVPIQKQKNKIR